MAHLSIKNLSNSFGTVKCLDKVNLEVGDGHLVVIVGPSGCGKTTLMRCIAGLEKSFEGSIFIDDKLINEKEPKDRDVAMVFQYYALYPHMTVRQNLSLGLEHTTDLTKEEIQARVEEIADILKISQLLGRKPDQLSGGESQRVAIGRALVRKPKIFLLDEPLSAIDAKLSWELRAEIRKIQRRFGVTTIYVTHDQEEAMAVGDKLVVIRDGKIHQAGTPREVFNNPSDQFVARFIGKPPMNFFQVTLNEVANKYLLKNKDFSYEISRGYYQKYMSTLLGRDLIIGVRPSSINMNNKATPVTTKTNIAVVSLIEDMGNETYVYLNIDTLKIIAKTSFETTFEIGEKILFTFQEYDMHIFDIKSKVSLTNKT